MATTANSQQAVESADGAYVVGRGCGSGKHRSVPRQLEHGWSDIVAPGTYTVVDTRPGVLVPGNDIQPVTGQV